VAFKHVVPFLSDVLPKLEAEGISTQAALREAIAAYGEDMSKLDKRKAVRAAEMTLTLTLSLTLTLRGRRCVRVWNVCVCVWVCV
jgi:hypothetical protein